MASLPHRIRYSKLQLRQEEEEEQDENDGGGDEQANSAWKDLLLALDDAKWIGSFVAVVIAVCMFKLLTQDAPGAILHTEDLPLEVLRPVLSIAQQHHVKHARMFARTNVAIRPDLNTTYHHHRRATKRGHLPLPELFYRGVVFGIAAHNTHNIPYMDTNFTDPLGELYNDLSQMVPRPTQIMDRYSFENETGWDEPGLAAYFEYDHLQAQGYKSDGPQPWQHVERKVLAIARKHKQICVYRWHPHKWGEGSKDNPFKHTTIVQEVLPTRTGLNAIRSTAMVYQADEQEDEETADPR